MGICVFNTFILDVFAHGIGHFPGVHCQLQTEDDVFKRYAQVIPVIRCDAQIGKALHPPGNAASGGIGDGVEFGVQLVPDVHGASRGVRIAFTSIVILRITVGENIACTPIQFIARRPVGFAVGQQQQELIIDVLDITLLQLVFRRFQSSVGVGAVAVCIAIDVVDLLIDRV